MEGLTGRAMRGGRAAGESRVAIDACGSSCSFLKIDLLISEA